MAAPIASPVNYHTLLSQVEQGNEDQVKEALDQLMQFVIGSKDAGVIDEIGTRIALTNPTDPEIEVKIKHLRKLCLTYFPTIEEEK
ncbi:MAG: hypothetical protein SP1CHLAM54_00670 [Chlamydiia bacterium]|nr:hypothetical protein [Chlamydiia bacterium]MCH9614989.1 hypothetical protein [Chlamydiia bacterium]MCH9629961.1 hypothetical protein [Chlamydiia bacterium]